MAKAQAKQNQIVVNGIILSLVITICFIIIAFLIIPPVTHEMATSQRLGMAVYSLIFPSLCFLAGVLVVGKSRFGNKAQDPTKYEAASQGMKINLRYLSNTQEQLFLFFLATLGLSLILPYDYLSLVWINSALFVLGRIVFWISYHVNVLYRAVGFGMTFFPATVGLLYCAIMVIKRIL